MRNPEIAAMALVQRIITWDNCRVDYVKEKGLLKAKISGEIPEKFEGNIDFEFERDMARANFMFENKIHLCFLIKGRYFNQVYYAKTEHDFEGALELGYISLTHQIFKNIISNF